MMEQIEGALVFDETVGKFLRRVADVTHPDEYSLDGRGLFTFHPSICGTKDRPGHKIQVTYDLSGPKVSLLNVRKKLTP